MVDKKMKIPDIFVTAANLFFAPDTELSTIIYPFLNVYVKKPNGTLMVLPLLSRKENSLFYRVGLTTQKGAYIIFWSPTQEILPISNTRTVIFLLSENDPSKTFSKTITLNGNIPQELVNRYEKLMDENNFFSGLVCCVIASNTEIKIFPTKDILNLK